jgi:hypothetical protein
VAEGVSDGVAVGLLVAVGVAGLIALGAEDVVARGRHDCSFVGVGRNMDAHSGIDCGGMDGVGMYARWLFCWLLVRPWPFGPLFP